MVNINIKTKLVTVVGLASGYLFYYSSYSEQYENRIYSFVFCAIIFACTIIMHIVMMREEQLQGYRFAMSITYLLTNISYFLDCVLMRFLNADWRTFNKTMIVISFLYSIVMIYLSSKEKKSRKDKADNNSAQAKG